MGYRLVHIVAIIIDASNHDERYKQQPYLPGAGKIQGLAPGINGA